MRLNLLVITDPGPDPDDVKALLISSVLHSKRQLRVRGIVANGGEDPRERAALAKCILDHVGVHDIPIGVGKAGSAAGPPHAHERAIEGFVETRRADLEDGAALIMRILHAAPDKSLTVLCISSLRDFADAIAAEPELVVAKVRTVAIQGGLQYDDMATRWQPDTSVNNEFDREAANAVYSFCFDRGLPMRIVSRNAVPKIPMQLARSFAMRTDCPVMSYLANAQFLGLEGLWQKLCAGQLPARCTKRWYAETFCGIGAEQFAEMGMDRMDATADIIQHLNGFIKPYDVVALMTVLPRTEHLFSQRALVTVQGVAHLLLLRQEHTILERHVLEVLRYTYHEVVIATAERHPASETPSPPAPPRHTALKSYTYFCGVPAPGSPTSPHVPDFRPSSRRRLPHLTAVRRGGDPDRYLADDELPPSPVDTVPAVGVAVLVLSVTLGTLVLLVALMVADMPRQAAAEEDGGGERGLALGGWFDLGALADLDLSLCNLSFKFALASSVLSIGAQQVEHAFAAVGKSPVIMATCVIIGSAMLAATHSAWVHVRLGDTAGAFVDCGYTSCMVAACVGFIIRVPDHARIHVQREVREVGEDPETFTEALGVLVTGAGFASIPHAVLHAIRRPGHVELACDLSGIALLLVVGLSLLHPYGDAYASSLFELVQGPWHTCMRGLTTLAAGGRVHDQAESCTAVALSASLLDQRPARREPAATCWRRTTVPRPGALTVDIEDANSVRSAIGSQPATPPPPTPVSQASACSLPWVVAEAGGTPGDGSLTVADVYLVQSPDDDAISRRVAIDAWAAEFARREGREPVIWLESFAVPDNGCATQAVRRIPMHMARSRRLLLLCGPTFFDNLRCAVECYMWLATGGSLADVDVRPVSSDEDDLAQIVATLDVFAVMYCKCSDEALRKVLEMTVQVANVDVFNEAIRSFFPIVREAVEDRRSPAAARRSVIQVKRSASLPPHSPTRAA